MVALPSPAALFALFAFGIEAVVGFILGTSTGLSEVHKTVLVAFVVIFPLLVLGLIWTLAARAERYEFVEDPQQV